MLHFQYAKFVKPAFDDFILPSKKYADIIIPRGGDNLVAIDLIVQHIRTKLGQHNLCKIYPNVNVIQSTFQVIFILLHLPLLKFSFASFPQGNISYADANLFLILKFSYRLEACTLLFVTGTYQSMILFFIQIG